VGGGAVMPYFCTHDGHELRQPEGEFCPFHGTPLLRDCPACGARWTEVGISYSGAVAGADFCIHCSRPAPWASRRNRIAWIKGRLHQHGLDEATELELREALDLLIRMEPGDIKAVAAWQKLKQVAPRLWEVAKPIITTVVTDDIKRRLGL
jgi:hypothetical protein